MGIARAPARVRARALTRRGARVRCRAVFFKRLYSAALNCDVHSTVWALAHSADPGWKNPDADGRTPVHAACESGSLVCLQLLLQNGGSLTVKDNSDVLPRDVAIASGHRLADLGIQ